MKYIKIDLQQAIHKLLNIEDWEFLDDRLASEGGVILSTENIDKLNIILEEIVNKEIDEIETERRNHVCDAGYPECNRRGSCDGSC